MDDIQTTQHLLDVLTNIKDLIGDYESYELAKITTETDTASFAHPVTETRVIFKKKFSDGNTREISIKVMDYK